MIWELIGPAEAAEWIGVPLPDLGFVEANLAILCALRTAARTGQLPATHAGFVVDSRAAGREPRYQDDRADLA